MISYLEMIPSFLEFLILSFYKLRMVKFFSQWSKPLPKILKQTLDNEATLTY